ncbi:MAG TPA: RagB/SusD family nutrient uptake outer membrane protein, partial [Flavobacteriaceae bacterium]|nr:RagB/SusD family nutrient uptake outer membrane protein [Flavobacteriaceae bacterium]
MKNIYKSILICSVLFLGACTNLDEVLVGDVTEPFSETEPSFGNFDGGGSGPSDAMSSAFAELRTGTASNGGIFSLQGVSTDEMAVTQKGGDWYDGGAWIALHRQTAGPTNDQVVNSWNDQYNAIGACNTVLASGNLDANQTAQVKVLRAYFYFRLMDLYGRVKIVTAPGQDPSQSTRAQVFAFVETELLDALGIPAVTASMDLSGSALNPTSSEYRVNQFGAMGLLAKLYLNAPVFLDMQNTDAAALTYFQKASWAAGYVIDNGGYVLCDTGCSVPNAGKRPAVASDPDELEGYAAVFAPNNQGNPEMIWAIAYDHSSGPGMNFAQMTLHYSSQFTWNLSDQPWNGFEALEDFYNSYDNADKRKKANFIVGPQLDYDGSAILDYAAEGGDLELDYTPFINELEPNSSRKGGARLGKFSFRQ